jgi:hypothetical protein
VVGDASAVDLVGDDWDLRDICDRLRG